MAQRQHFYSEDLTETTTTSTTYGDKVSLTATFDSGVDYFLFYSAKVSNTTNATADAKLRFQDDTAGTTLREVNYESRTTVTNEYHVVFGIDKYTGDGASHTFSIEFAAESAGNSIRCRDASILALRADASDQYAESEGVSTETAVVLTDKTTLSFTPASTGDYLLIASAETNNSSTGVEAYCELVHDNTSTLYGEGTRGNKDANNWYAWNTGVRLNLAASSQTFKIRFRTQDGIGEISSIRKAAIVALRLDAQVANYYAETRGETATNSTTFQDAVTLTQTPNAGDHLVIWFGQLNLASTSEVVTGRLIEGSTELSAHSLHGPGGRTDNVQSSMALFKRTLAATSTTWKTQVKVTTGGGTNGKLVETGIAIIELESAGGGGGVSLSGQSETIAQGSLAVQLLSAITGESSADSHGVLIGSSSKTLDGSSFTYQQGNVSPQADGNVELTGQPESTSHGQVSANLSGSVSGSFIQDIEGSVSADSSMQINGNGLVFSLGTVSPLADGNVTLSGSQESMFQQTFTATIEVRL